MPLLTLSNAVIVVVPVIITLSLVVAPMFTVEADASVADPGGIVPVYGATAAFVYLIHCQLPPPKLMNSAVSLAAVEMFAAPGRIRLVALCVSVKALENLTHRLMPLLTLSKAVIVVVPLIMTLSLAAPPMFTVEADASVTGVLLCVT